MRFEVGWFDEDENTSAAISALATDANMVRSLIADRTSVLVQTISTAFVAYSSGLYLTWRLALVLIADHTNRRRFSSSKI